MSHATAEPGTRTTVFISSTAIDLPEHRARVKEACLRIGFVPDGMEEWSADPHDAVTASLAKLDRADIYLGVYGFRYGTVPPGDELSITEREYRHAAALGLPMLLFCMGDDHPVLPAQVETGPGAERLRAFKAAADRDHVMARFDSVEALHSRVFQALVELRDRREAAGLPVSYQPSGNAIPTAPEPYIAHPYVLMQLRRLVGREEELSLLTDWVAKPDSEVHRNPMLSFIAIGGMGKSALTWEFFNRIAPQEMRPLAGRLWWSFYESDSHFESFVAHALAYCSGQGLEVVRKLDLATQLDQLWQALNVHPFLLVLDGLERILVAYSRLDAPRMLDDELDEQSANYIADAHGLPQGAGETYLARHRLRTCTDPRAGRFLQALTQLHQSRVLISSRLYPADIQTRTARPVPGSFVHLQQGLTTNDAVELWRMLGVKGARDELLPFFESCNHHPLLIQAMAGEVAEYRAAPGDYAAWRAAHPGFVPAADLDLRQRQSHILQFALDGLGGAQRRVLHTLAGLRMASGYDTVRELLVGEGNPCADEGALDRVLAELEDRGLLGWERSGNRYDLHPIVRGVVWQGLHEGERRQVLEGLKAHFAAQPMVENWREVESLTDLEPAIELYDKLIGLGRYQRAFELFRDRIENATLYRLSAARRRLELLSALFPNNEEEGEPGLPRLEGVWDQSYVLNTLALAYLYSGQPGTAVGLLRQKTVIDEREGYKGSLIVGLGNFFDSQRRSGALHGAEYSVRRALGLAREMGYKFDEAVILQNLGAGLSSTGQIGESDQALQQAVWIFQQQHHQQSEGVSVAYRAELALYVGQASQAQSLAEHAWELAQVHRVERDFIRAARLEGTATLHLGDLDRADERLHHALQRARAVDLAEEELQALVALAELHHRRGDPNTARDRLEQVWDPAERGPYPLFHADALNFLARIERDAGNTEAAIAAATDAYRLAWCDGPPYAYHWGLEAARRHLAELGAPEPELPPFDPAAHEPMPEVEIDPPDTESADR